MESPWLDQSQLAAWVRLVGVLELLPEVLDEQLRQDADLTHDDYEILALLSDADGSQMHMQDLARESNATLPQLTRDVVRLEERGLVRRVRSTADRRETDAQLTEAGEAKTRAAAPGHVATVRHYVIDALTPEQITQLHDIADALLARLDPDGNFAATSRRPPPGDARGGSPESPASPESPESAADG